MPDTKCDTRMYQNRSLDGRLITRHVYQAKKPVRVAISSGLKRTYSEERSRLHD